MKKAGIKTVSLGLESVNPKTLNQVNKGESIDRYIYAIKMLKKYKLNITGTFGVGAGNDTKKILIQ